MKIVSEQQLAAGFAKMRADLEPLRNQNDAIGISSRLQLAAGEAINRAIITEYERESSPEDLEEALLVYLANTAMAFINLLQFDNEAERLAAIQQFCGGLYGAMIFRLDDKNVGDAHFTASVETGGRA